MAQKIPTDYKSRQPLWTKSSFSLGCNDDPFIMLSVQNLGYAEKILLQMETTLAQNLGTTENEKIVQGLLITECSAHSILWIYGLYEAIRNVREMKMAQFEPLKTLFQKLEIVRMPLAKHEVKGTPQYRNKFHYPTSLWSPENGYVGWHVFNPLKEENEVFMRTDLANEFLAITTT